MQVKLKEVEWYWRDHVHRVTELHQLELVPALARIHDDRTNFQLQLVHPRIYARMHTDTRTNAHTHARTHAQAVGTGDDRHSESTVRAAPCRSAFSG